MSAAYCPERAWSARWGLHLTPADTRPDHADPARRMRYYTGVGHPYHLSDTPAPLFISIPTLTRYAAYRGQGQDWPCQSFGARWAGDSGAYAALMLNKDNDAHPWSMDPDTYGSLWVTYVEAISHEAPQYLGPDFIAVQDWPCEPGVRERTGMSVREHQELTLESYLYLSREFDFLPWLPILQGWTPAEYVDHFAMYERAGIDLRGQRVGIGSVCRRGSQAGISAVLHALAPLGMRMHGFGVSINGLRLAGHLLASSDSQAWSATARRERIRLDGCTHMSRPDRVTGERQETDCRNCFRYALAYREEVMQALRDGAADRTRGKAQGVLF